MLCAFAVIAAVLVAPEPIAPDLTVQDLDTGVWLIVHERPFPANALLVEAKDGTLVLCDTPYTDRATRDLLGWIDDRFGERRLVVVNGHFHPDCTGGNGALIEAGAEVWGSDLTAELVEKRGEELLSALARGTHDECLAGEIRATEPTAPNHTFVLEDGHSFDFGERIRVFFPGRAHAPDNMVTYCEDRSLVFAGCMCFSSERTGLGYVGDADLDVWPAALQNLGSLDSKTVVPGHGSPGGSELVTHTLEVLREHP